MSQRNEDLDDLLNEYVAASEVPDYKVCTEWCHRYPEYALDLFDFTVAWIIMEGLALNEAWENEEDSDLTGYGC